LCNKKPAIAGFLLFCFWCSTQNQIVPVDHFRFVNVAQNFFDILAGAPRDAARVAAAVIGQAAGDLMTIDRDSGHCVLHSKSS